jgi:thymidylate synthase (FAD)
MVGNVNRQTGRATGCDEGLHALGRSGGKGLTGAFAIVRAVPDETDAKIIQFRSDITVQLVRSSASDSDVLFAARVSTQGEQTLESAQATDAARSADGGEAEDKRARGLINYLMRDRHGSPFEHNSMTFYVQAPIFVFREFMRHRIASYNEESGRYRELNPLFYVPASDRNLLQVGKPGAYSFEPGTAEQVQLVQEQTRRSSTDAFEAYQRMLDAGVAREVARIVLPLNIYSSMYVTLNARSLMNFLSLRTKREGSQFPSFPQREIEMAAEQMETFFEGLMPLTYAAFNGNGRVAP